jgi:ribonuclease HII
MKGRDVTKENREENRPDNRRKNSWDNGRYNDRDNPLPGLLDEFEREADPSSFCDFEPGKVLRKDDLAFLEIDCEETCGMDEAGRGPLAGPVCAAAVILPGDFPLEILDDSKALTANLRDRAYNVIVEKAIAWAVGWASCEEIGKLNILNASLLAMQRAYNALGVTPKLALVDGNKAPLLTGARIHPVIRGDACVPSIMAASILAKVARDRVMKRLDCVEPYYGFAKHKGYPTAEHRDAIRRYGLSQWARPGFKSS